MMTPDHHVHQIHHDDMTSSRYKTAPGLHPLQVQYEVLHKLLRERGMLKQVR